MSANWSEVRSERMLSAAMSVGSNWARTMRRVPLRCLRSRSRAAWRSLWGMLARTMAARSTSAGSWSPWWRVFLPMASRMPPMRPAARAKAIFLAGLGVDRVLGGHRQVEDADVAGEAALRNLQFLGAGCGGTVEPGGPP